MVVASMTRLDYIRDGQEIYRQSFATIEKEAGLERLPVAMRPVATRLIHACGMVDAIDDLAWSDKAVEAGKATLAKGAAIFTDVEMVKAGIISRNLPAENPIICTLNAPGVVERAAAIGNTRSAAAVEFWPHEQLEGSVVVIGNAPTALFHLLELLDKGAARPALIIGIPVGFVGAVESKQELAKKPRGCEYITLHGRCGGSAIASAVLNAIAAGASA